LAGHFAIVFKVLERVGQERPVFLQKAMHFHTGFEAEQSAGIGFRQAVIPVSVERNGF
jgi:hypothetical protein